MADQNPELLKLIGSQKQVERPGRRSVRANSGGSGTFAASKRHSTHCEIGPLINDDLIGDWAIFGWAFSSKLNQQLRSLRRTLDAGMTQHIALFLFKRVNNQSAIWCNYQQSVKCLLADGDKTPLNQLSDGFIQRIALSLEWKASQRKVPRSLHDVATNYASYHASGECNFTLINATDVSDNAQSLPQKLNYRGGHASRTFSLTGTTFLSTREYLFHDHITRPIQSRALVNTPQALSSIAKANKKAALDSTQCKCQQKSCKWLLPNITEWNELQALNYINRPNINRWEFLLAPLFLAFQVPQQQNVAPADKMLRKSKALQFIKFHKSWHRSANTSHLVWGDFRNQNKSDLAPRYLQMFETIERQTAARKNIRQCLKEQPPHWDDSKSQQKSTRIQLQPKALNALIEPRMSHVEMNIFLRQNGLSSNYCRSCAKKSSKTFQLLMTN